MGFPPSASWSAGWSKPCAGARRRAAMKMSDMTIGGLNDKMNKLDI